MRRKTKMCHGASVWGNWVIGARERLTVRWLGAPTFSTNADFKHPGAETVTSWHTEARVGGVVFGAHEDVIRGCKAVCLNPFHLHVFHIG